MRSSDLGTLGWRGKFGRASPEVRALREDLGAHAGIQGLEVIDPAAANENSTSGFATRAARVRQLAPNRAISDSVPSSTTSSSTATASWSSKLHCQLIDWSGCAARALKWYKECLNGTRSGWETAARTATPWVALQQPLGSDLTFQPRPLTHP